MNKSKSVKDKMQDTRQIMSYNLRSRITKVTDAEKWIKPPAMYKHRVKIRPPYPDSHLGSELIKLANKLEHKQWSDYKTQKQVYWLLIDHVIPHPHIYRTRIDGTYGTQDWKAIDGSKLYTYSKQIAFHWRSTHGKLYANKDFHRFKVKDTPNCTGCDNQNQDVDHLYTKCTRTNTLFANFHRHYKLDTPLTECEKLIGIDTTIQRSKLTLKRLGILRKAIYDHNHRDETLRWQGYLYLLERIYTMEYSIADSKGRLDRHFKAWDM